MAGEYRAVHEVDFGDGGEALHAVECGVMPQPWRQGEAEQSNGSPWADDTPTPAARSPDWPVGQGTQCAIPTPPTSRLWPKVLEEWSTGRMSIQTTKSKFTQSLVVDVAKASLYRGFQRQGRGDTR